MKCCFEPVFNIFQKHPKNTPFHTHSKHSKNTPFHTHSNQGATHTHPHILTRAHRFFTSMNAVYAFISHRHTPARAHTHSPIREQHTHNVTHSHASRGTQERTRRPFGHANTGQHSFTRREQHGELLSQLLCREQPARVLMRERPRRRLEAGCLPSSTCTAP